MNVANRLTRMLIVLTLLLIGAQLSFFIIHYAVSSVIDTLIENSITRHFMSSVIFVPVVQFVAAQMIIYFSFIWLIRYCALSLGELLQLSKNAIYLSGILLFFIACVAIFSLNAIMFPESFFARPVLQSALFVKLSDEAATISTFILLFALMMGLANSIIQRRRIFQTAVIISFILITIGLDINDARQPARLARTGSEKFPDIILIGIDSLRPDHTGFFGDRQISTPNIDRFLQSSLAFSNAYTPLARTFPSWVSILTGKYPLNNLARINLTDPSSIHSEDTIAKQLHDIGYQTIYATDEKRFSNIDQQYGFDQIIGPPMGVNDFLLGSLSDFPLSNILVNTVWGRFMFPYQYGNRAANVTYKPESFMKLVRRQLAVQQGKPVFLAVHLCLSHWPYTWPQKDMRVYNDIAPEKYKVGVQGVDHQLGQLLDTLTAAGLLQHSMAIMLSDHGTTLGMQGDRLVAKEKYIGDADKMKFLPVYKLSGNENDGLDVRRDFVLDTSHGQATDVLSLKQYQVLLAFRGYGITFPVGIVSDRVSLIDIAPTILAYLRQPQMAGTDGISLLPVFSQQSLPERPLYFETGSTFGEIETDKINVEGVFAKSARYYRINPANGLIYVDPTYQQSVIDAKQRAVLFGDWLLARYPQRDKLVLDQDVHVETVPPYYVLSNIRTGDWTVDFSAPLVSAAKRKKYEQLLLAFYGNELSQQHH